jgi:K+-sensing histidine kinase KdpD
MKTGLAPDAADCKIELDLLMQENKRLRGDLLTVARRISHDLRTPLGAIITTSEIVKEVLAENGSSGASLMAPVFDSAEEMTKLIGQVSFVLKATANPIAKERVNMGSVVFRVLQHLERKILQKNVTILEPASWPVVNGVFPWLEVIWGNYLANTLRHGKDKVELGWREEKKEFRFWVCDNGNGVPKEKCDKLFQPFDSLYEPDATPGLGLSIVQRLVGLQDGRCGYEPRLGGGCCFYFILPAENIAASPNPPREQ